jgi:hypothetical protein
VHVDDLDPLAADHDGNPVLRRTLRMCASQHPATAERDPGRNGGGAALKKLTACGHDDFLPGCFLNGPGASSPGQVEWNLGEEKGDKQSVSGWNNAVLVRPGTRAFG